MIKTKVKEFQSIKLNKGAKDVLAKIVGNTTVITYACKEWGDKRCTYELLGQWTLLRVKHSVAVLRKISLVETYGITPLGIRKSEDFGGDDIIITQ